MQLVIIDLDSDMQPTWSMAHTTRAAFLRNNADNANLCADVRAMKRGDKLRAGGGACGAVAIWAPLASLRGHGDETAHYWGA